MIINIADVWADAEIDHRNYVKAQIHKRIKRIVRSEPDTRIRSTVLAFTRYFLDSLLDVAQTEFTDAIVCYEKMFPAGRSREQAKKIFNILFNYDAFSNKEKYLNGKWCAYELCARARFHICPYCHLQSIATAVPNPSANIGGYRPELDHYFSKSDYPFLALSLGNLIPSCETCNGPKMKHDHDVGFEPTLHPFGHEESVRFALGEGGEFESPLMWNLQGKDSAYCIEVMAHRNIALASTSMRIFQLKSRYNETSLIAEVLERLRELGREWDQTHLLFHFVAKTDYRNLEKDGYRNRFRGRLFRDLHEQLCVPL